MSVPKLQDLGIIRKNSEEFSKKNKFGSTSTTCEELLKRGFQECELVDNANSAYPIIHHKVLQLVVKFIDLKKEHGSRVEKQIYKDITVTQFIDRLLTKRPLLFVGQRDTYILRDQGVGDDWAQPAYAMEKWHTVGQQGEEAPLVMEDYLTYDEGKVAALLGASTHTITANKGDRKNSGTWNDEADWERRGVIVGLVGPRMHKSGAMESQELKVDSEQNLKRPEKNSVLQLFAEFYGMKTVYTYNQVRQAFDSRDSKQNKVVSTIKNMVYGTDVSPEDYIPIVIYRPITEEIYLHLSGYIQRIRMTADMLLVEASSRAVTLGKKAYVQVVGLGLGVWKISPKQHSIFAATYLDSLADLNLPNISNLNFSWILPPSEEGEMPMEVDWRGGKAVNGSKVSGTDTVLHIGRRDPWEKLDGEDKLMVAAWAWDGMSFVGNEYWAGSLATSSDPAAACSTQIPELLNPCVNPVFCGANTKVVTKEGTLVSLEDAGITV